MAASNAYRERDRIYLAATGTRGWAAGTATLAASALAPALLTLTACALFPACFSAPALLAYGIAGGVVAAAWGCASVLVGHGRQLEVAGAALAVAALCLLLAVPAARSDLYAFCNAVIWHVDEASGTLFELIPPGDTVAGTPVFGALVGTVAGVLWWRITRLHTAAPTLILMVVCCASSLYLGLGHGASVILGIGGWLAHCRLTQLDRARTSWMTLLLNLSAAFAVCAALLGLCVLAYSPASPAAELRTSVVEAIDRFRFGDRVLPEGDLSRAADLNGATDNHLDITVDGTPATDLLLRGYVGATFKDGSWAPIDHTAYSGRWNGLASWLEGRGFTPSRQRSLYDALKNKEQGEKLGEYEVEVHADATDRRYAFVPYAANDPEGLDSAFEQDGAIRRVLWGDRGYSFDVDNVPATQVIDDASWLSSSKAGYVESERVYGAFAKSAYTKIGKRERAAVERYIFDDDTWDASAATSRYAVISRVRTMLGTLASYSDTPARPKSGETFCDWFLGEAREGNSAYFATAAALAFRSQGIPARYVEGYRATATEIARAEKVGGGLRLGSSDLHAWVEIYIDGLGWTPVEVTPGFYSQALDADSIIDVSEAWSGGSESDALQAGSVMGSVDKRREDERGQVGKSAWEIVLDVLAVIACSALIAVLAVVVERRVRMKVRRDRMACDDQSVCVPELYRVLSLIMRAGLPGFDPARPLDGLEEFPRAFKGVGLKEYRRVVELHQSYAFGGRELRPNELRAVRRLTERMHAAMPAPWSLGERFRRYAIDIL